MLSKESIIAALTPFVENAGESIRKQATDLVNALADRVSKDEAVQAVAAFADPATRKAAVAAVQGLEETLSKSEAAALLAQQYDDAGHISATPRPHFISTVVLTLEHLLGVKEFVPDPPAADKVAA